MSTGHNATMVIDKPIYRSILTRIASDPEDNELSPSKQLCNCLNLQEINDLFKYLVFRAEIATADAPSVLKEHQCIAYTSK